MKRIALPTLIAAGLVVSQIARAHDGVDHEGKGTEGQIVSIADNQFELNTATETLQVTLSSKTKFEYNHQAVDKTHLTKGEHVTVMGTKLPSGEMVAKEVVIGQMDAHAGDHSGTPHPPSRRADSASLK